MKDMKKKMTKSKTKSKTMGYAKGGMVKANCGASMKPSKKTKGTK